MARRRNDDPSTPEEEVPSVPLEEATPPLPTEAIGSTLPNGEKRSTPGDRPCAKFGPYPCGERAFLSLAIWKKEVTKEGGEVITLYSVQVQRTYYNGPTGTEPKNSNTLRAAEIPLAIVLLEKAQTWIESQK